MIFYGLLVIYYRIYHIGALVFFNCFRYFNCFFNNLEYYNLTYHMDWRQTGVDIEAKLLWSEGISSKIWRNYDSVITTIWLPYEIKPSFPVNHGYKYGLTHCQDRPVKMFKGTEFGPSLFGPVRSPDCPGEPELVLNLILQIKQNAKSFIAKNHSAKNRLIRKFWLEIRKVLGQFFRKNF